MRNFNLYIILFFAAYLSFINVNAYTVSDIDAKVEAIVAQLLEKYNIVEGKFPEYTVDGKWQFRKDANWFSGFIGGELWQLYGITKDERFKDRAIKVADNLIQYAEIDYTHDMGFIFFPSVVKAYQLTGEKKYRDAAYKAALMLAKRFNKNGNFIRAWGKLGTDDRSGVVIIDTMMNLELLFWAADELELPELYEIAYKHAVICMNEHVREDYSTYHVVEYDPSNGNVLKKYTHQGYGDKTTWARGQAWAIYGFAKAYKYTDDIRFLNLSIKLGNYFLKHLPDDFVPIWDLSLSGNDELRDASAGAIAASGMYLLSDLSKTKDDHIKYSAAADSITESLLNNYLFTNSKREVEQGLLIHTIYHFHKKWGVDESYPCGDYFLTEALNKYYTKKTENAFSGELRESININKDWYYLEDNIKDFSKLHLTAETWNHINLPHTWNAFDVTDQKPGYRRDASWYRKDFNMEVIDENKNYYAVFEGININTEVYLNGKELGKHIGGYVGFQIDLTEVIREGVNVLYVRADNSIDPEVIPSQKSDFNIFGGISRDVYLKTVAKNHVNKVLISTPIVSDSTAQTKLKIKFNCTDSGDYICTAALKDNDGHTLISKENKIVLKLNDNNFVFDLPELSKPHLWSVDDPYLYEITIDLFKDGVLVDTYNDRIGYRWYEFKEHGPFYLNGKPLLLRGTHRHEEHAGLGNAMSNELHRKDIRMIKELGANFIRLAHYPQDPEVYKAADELGLLIWDELPWCRGGVGNKKWKDNTKRLFIEQIEQNYNHPSIILWSVGNEVYWLPDFPGGGNTDSLRSFTKELHELSHSLDPYRLTSIRKFYEGAEIVDVFSPSIWAGWYSGVYKSYLKAINEAINKYSRFFHAEFGGSSHLGRHTETTITGDGLLNPDEWSEEVNQVQVKNIAQLGDWSESYIVDLFDWSLNVSEHAQNFTGNAQWAFKDFGTPLRPENPIPYMNQKGLVDRAGNPKDAYYVFKSYWTEFPKFCYIESHTWTERSGRNELGKEINVFSNCDEVELFVNGKSFGKKLKDLNKFPASGLSWEIQLSEGNNMIVAMGYNGDKTVKDTTEFNYYITPNEKPEEIKLSFKKLKNSNYLIIAKVLDKNGRQCTDYNKRVFFSAEGSGKLLESYGTYTKSSVIEFSNGYAAIEYKPIPFETAVIEARNQDFKGSYINIKY